MKQDFSMPSNQLALFDEGTAAPTDAGAQDSAAQDAAACPQSTDAKKRAERLTNPGSSRRDRRAGAAQRRGQLEAAKQTAATPAATTGSDAKTNPPAETPAATPEQPTIEKPEARRERFRTLVDGEFKDLYTEAVQSIIDRRFRQTKRLEEQLAAQRPVVEALLAQYGIHDGDVAKLAHAVGRDQDAPPDMAPHPDHPPQAHTAQPEAQHVQADAMDGQYNDWMRQAEQTKAVHSTFDLHAEVRNPLFLSMLKARVPMQHAYEVLHLDEIKGGIAQQSAHRTEKEVLERIRAKGARPVENGVSSQNGIPMHAGLSHMSRKDRADIVRRAARGERITF